MKLNQPYAFQLKHREVDNEPKVIFDVIKVLELAEDSGVQSLQVLDLDRRLMWWSFAFSNQREEDVVNECALFDEVKFGAGGRLFFKQAPDFETLKISVRTMSTNWLLRREKSQPIPTKPPNPTKRK